MSWADDFAAKQQKTSEVRKASADSPSYIGGFLASGFSALGEMFGQNPSDRAEEFRAENPVMGVVSEIAPTLIPYAGMARVSALPKAAAALEGVVARTGLTALENPVAYGAVKEMARYAPLELGRLGVGLATDEGQDNWGNLLADVGLSVALTGGFGAMGGFFRSGGKTELGKALDVPGTDFALRDTFKVRAALDQPGLVDDATLAELRQSVLTESPNVDKKLGLKGNYVQSLDGGTPEADAAVNSLFKKGGKNNSGYTRQLLLEGSGTGSLAEGEQQALMSALGFNSVDEFAATAVFPRKIVVNTPEGALDLATKLDKSAMQEVGPGVLMGREANDGLFVMAKRLKAGAMEGAEQATAKFQAAQGDEWLVFKTDKPQRFVPEASKIAQANVASWSKMRGGYAPTAKADPINQSMESALRYVTPQEAQAVKNMPTQKWKGQMMERLGERMYGVTGVKDSAAIKGMVDTLHDWFKPAMFQEAQNPLFGRMNTLLRSAMGTADYVTKRIVGGQVKLKGNAWQAVRGAVEFSEGFEGNRSVAAIIKELSDDEFKAVVQISNAQLPKAELDRLVAEGTISARSVSAAQELQKVNGDFLSKVFLPALEGSDGAGKFEALEGYIAPRVYKGNFFVDMLDAKGKLKYLVSGKTAAAAQEEAKLIAAEAAGRGRALTPSKVRHSLQSSAPDLSRVQQEVNAALGGDKDIQDVVQKVQRQLLVKQFGKGEQGSIKPGKWARERTGLPGTPDVGYTKDEFIQNIQSHYSQLGRYAAYHAFQQRFGEEAFRLGQVDATLATALKRKADQWLGIEGQITNTLNKTLEPLLGNVLGGKAATRIAAETNKLLYAWQLGIVNPTFALLNLLTPLQTVMPWASFVTKASDESLMKYMQFSPRYDESGQRVMGAVGSFHAMKVMREATRLMSKPTPEFKQVLEQLKTEGTVSAHLYEGWIGEGAEAAGTIKGAFQKGNWEGIKTIATYMSTKSEEYSRVMSAGAAYSIGKDVYKLEGDQLLHFIRQGVRVTNYGYSVMDRPRIITGPIGSTFGLFKNFQFNFIGQMMQYAGVGMKEGNWGPMMWQGASALALGGVGATPLKMLADGLANWQEEGSNSFLWMQENWDKDVADSVYFGLPAFLGVSLQSSAMLPGTDVRNDVSSLFNIVAVERGKAIGKAVGAAWGLGSATDDNALRNPQIRDQLLNAFAPRAFSKLASSVEGDYVKSMSTGYASSREVGPMAQVLNGLGFNPLDVAEQQIAGRLLWDRQEEQRAMISGMGQGFQAAMETGDVDEMTRLTNRAVAMGVPLDRVYSSAMTRQKRAAGDGLSRYGQAEALRYRQAFED